MLSANSWSFGNWALDFWGVKWIFLGFVWSPRDFFGCWFLPPFHHPVTWNPEYPKYHPTMRDHNAITSNYLQLKLNPSPKSYILNVSILLLLQVTFLNSQSGERPWGKTYRIHEHHPFNFLFFNHFYFLFLIFPNSVSIATQFTL